MNLSFSANFGNSQKNAPVDGHGDVQNSKFVNRLASFPAVSSGADVLNSGADVLKKNPLTAMPLQMTKTTTRLLAAPFNPLASLSFFVLEPLIQPILDRIDAVAHDGLARVESTVPLITEEPGKILADIKHFVFLPFTKAEEGKHHIEETYSHECSVHGNGILAKGRAVVCTQLIVFSDGLLWIRSVIGAAQKQATEVVKGGRN
ncbi:MAG: hypothetical protein Q9174_003754 [Haloplaca sp. 1 TL-2023]